MAEGVEVEERHSSIFNMWSRNSTDSHRASPVSKWHSSNSDIAKGWFLLSPPTGIPHLSSLDESGHAFPSVFGTPFSKSSLYSFLLALPTISTSSPAAQTFSPLSTLAFLSVSVSLKSTNVSGSMDDRLHLGCKTSPATTFITALWSLFSSGKSAQDLASMAENAPQSSPRLLQSGSSRTLTSDINVSGLSQKPVQKVYMHTSGDDHASELGADESLKHVMYGDALGTLEDVPELKSAVGVQNGGSQSHFEKIESMSKYLVAGAVSTIVARTFVAPLERLKLEYIVRGAKNSWLKVVHRIWILEGPGGFWKGHVLNLLRTVPFKSINFLAYDLFCKEILERQGKEEVTNLDRLVAGAASGAAATLLCLPLDTMRTRLIAPGGETLGGMLGCFNRMMHKEGFLSLYKGLLPSLLSMVPASAVFYGVYDILKTAYLQSPEAQREFQKRIKERGSNANDGAIRAAHEIEETSPQLELGPMRTLLYGAIAGACAEIVTYPLEVVRRQLQLQQTAVKIGLIATFQTIIKQDGLSALFSGVLPSTAQVLPSAALSYLTYEFMKSFLKLS